jgi:outer membrane usher protein
VKQARASAGATASRGLAARRHLLPALIGMLLCSWGGKAVAAVTAGPGAADADAVDASFDRSMLSGAGQNTTDLSRFERGDFVPPGDYRVDVYLNDRLIGRSDVRFAAASPDASATPCVTRELLDMLGLHPADLSARATADLASGTACVDFGEIIPGASMSLDMADLRLDATVPQAFLGQMARGYVDPAYWDSGVTAGLLNYNFNSYRTTSQGLAQTSAYLGLNAGLNLGRWHLRQDSALTWQSAVGDARARRHWQNTATYAQRDLPAIRAQLTVGDSWTSGDVFDSLGVRGIQVATDDRMLPQSLRGYAPTVRGVADSNARVTVRQNGMVIHETTVSPGPFVINDLYSTGYGGDLQVTVAEANGRVHAFSVPYASVPQLLRPGVTRFSAVAGELRDRSIQDDANVLQATLQHGFSNLLTGYAGVAGSQGYAAALLGGALNTHYGAFAMDVTGAHTRIPGMDTLSGQSVRLSYSKIMAQTGTALTVAAYRYSTGGFLALGDAARARDYARRGLPVFASGESPTATNAGVPPGDLLTPEQQAALVGSGFIDAAATIGVDRQRSNFSVTLNQQLGTRGGSLYVNGSVRDYWNRRGTDTQFQLGYNNAIGPMTYNVSASRERDLLGRSENRYTLSLTLPLGDSTHAPILTGALTRDSGGGMQEQATVSGTAGRDDQFSYGATAAHDNTVLSGSTGSINGGYHGTHVQLNGGIGVGSGYSQSSLSVAGGIVAHPGGVTFGQPLGDTVAIVEAAGAEGARVGNAAGLRVDRRGFALVPYLTPYVLNTVTLDPAGLSLDVQLDNTSAQVAPRAGAVVMVKFKADTGRFMLIKARLADDRTLPFGAQVEDEKGQVIGVVGQAGRVMMRVSHETGRTSVRWQDAGHESRCSFSYRVPAAPAGAGASPYAEQSAVCSMPPAVAAPDSKST